MKYVFIIEYFPNLKKVEITGGVESRCYHVVKELSKTNKIVVITSYKKGDNRVDYFNNKNIIVYRVGMSHNYSHSGSFIERLSFAYSAYKKCVELKCVDLIDGQSFLTYLPAFYASKSLRVPVVMTYHETWISNWIKNKGFITGLFGEMWERMSLQKIKNNLIRVICVSNFTKNKLVELGVLDTQIDVIYNGVNVKKYRELKVNKSSSTVVCCINRLVSGKRVEDILRAVQLVKKSFPNIKCIIIGDGNERVDLDILKIELKIENNIKFLGYISDHNEVIKYLKSSHVYCSASFIEGFGITVIEAIACGVPFVISDIEPFDEITHNGKGGLIFKCGDYNDLANNILTLLNSREIYDKKVSEGQELVKKYDWEKIAREIEVTYEKVVV